VREGWDKQRYRDDGKCGKRKNIPIIQWKKEEGYMKGERKKVRVWCERKCVYV